MKKILIVSTIGLDYEGITSVIFNYVSHMDLSEIRLEFIAFKTINQELKEKFEQIGIVHLLPSRKTKTSKYITGLCRILKHKYDVIHIHGNSGTMLIEVACARIYGIHRILVHGHNSLCSHRILHRLFKIPMLWMSTDYLACSDSVGKWLYGNKKYLVLNNAIDIDKFTYREDIRIQMRRELSTEKEFVIGHVGRFEEQKNHTFLIDIFASYYKINSKTRLLMIGDGPEIDKIKSKVCSFGLEDKVIFTGKISEPEKFYQAMDLFILPSLWEGLPVVILEAQASGLPVLVSDNVTQEAKCTSEVFYLSLSDSAEKWAEKIYEISLKNIIRKKDNILIMSEHQFNINHEAEVLRKLYLC